MKLALLGFGKMGRTVEVLALKKGYEIVLIIDSDNQHELTIAALQQADVAIEFSQPEYAVDNIFMCFDAGIPVVSGTTGWLSRLNDVVAKLRSKNATLFYSSNYSLGVYAFQQAVKRAIQILPNANEFTISIDETHHVHKLDKPSGTAISTAKIVLDEAPHLSQWQLDNGDGKTTLPINAHRQGENKGNHTVTIDGATETIKLTHFAKSREGFAMGALSAAQFIKDKKGFFGMEDLLNA